MEAPEIPLPQEDSIKIEGFKNPLYLVIIGFATPRVLEAARRSKKEIAHILVIEPSLGHFHQTLKRDWVGDLTKDESIEFLIGIEPRDMMPYLYKIFTKSDAKLGSRATKCANPEIIVDPFAYPPVDGKNNPIADQISKIVIDSVHQVFLSMGCSSDSFNRLEQTINNEKSLQDCYRIQPLFEKFSQTPAIVLGAGPSLDDFIKEYKLGGIEDKALIIACDASLGLLLKNGIKPHIVTRCERKFTKIFNGIKKENTEDIFYAAYPWCSPEYFDLFSESFMLFRSNGVCRFTHPFDPGNVNGGVSSANAALELAYLFKCPKIYLAGIDLCFIGEQSHIEGTEVEFDIEKSRPKWTEIEGNSGKVTTIPVWNRCLNEYAGGVVKYEAQKFTFNTSKQGAKIPGVDLIEWGKIKEDLSKSTSTLKPLDLIRKYLDKHPPGYGETFKQKKITAAIELEKIKHDLEKLFLNIHDTLMVGNREEERAVAQLKAIDNPKEFFTNSDTLLKNFNNMYQEPCRQIDAFKKKYFTNEIFSITVMDICQIDLFQMENRCSSLKNIEPHEYLRLKTYTLLNLTLFRQFHYYLTMLINLLKNGANMSVEYKPFHYPDWGKE